MTHLDIRGSQELLDWIEKRVCPAGPKALNKTQYHNRLVLASDALQAVRSVVSAGADDLAASPFLMEVHRADFEQLAALTNRFSSVKCHLFTTLLEVGMASDAANAVMSEWLGVYKTVDTHQLFLDIIKNIDVKIALGESRS